MPLRAERLVAVAALVLIAVVFLRVSANNPPGFYKDESAISYNAYTLSASGKDEFGAHLPLFIKSFGDWKSPLYVYLLAGVFEVTGPSAEVARTFSAVLGLAAILVLYALAFAITRKPYVATAVALVAGLSPWLFETTRLVFAVALLPLLIALLLFTVHRAAAGTWRRRHSVAIGLLLAAIAYTYQAGRVLAPLFAVGIALCWLRARPGRVALAWGVFLAGIAPIGAFALRHPGALEARYHATTYIHAGMSPWGVGWQFLVHYARNWNLWTWLVRGDSNLRHHVHGDGSLSFVEVGLALAGAAVVLARRRADPWWRFVLFGVLVSPVPASLTVDSIHTLRMIALPVFLPVLALPALEAIGSLPRRRVRAAIAAAVLALFAVEAVNWQVVYHRNGPGRLSAFGGQARAAVDAAFRHGRTVYSFRSRGLYISLLFYGLAEGRPSPSTVVLDGYERPPAGALFVDVRGECPQCPILDERGVFRTYRYEPAAPGLLRTSFQLNSPLLPVGSPLQLLVEADNNGAKPADHVVLTIKLPTGMRLLGPPSYQRGTGCTGSSTLRCDIGFFPKHSFALFRYGVQVTQGGPLTMTARLDTDKLGVNPAGSGSGFTVDLLPPAYAKRAPGPR